MSEAVTSPSARSSIPVLKPAMSSASPRQRSSSGTVQPPTPTKSAVRGSVITSPTHAANAAPPSSAYRKRPPSTSLSPGASFGGPASPRPSTAPSPHGQVHKGLSVQAQRRKPSLLIERPAVRFTESAYSASPRSAASAATSSPPSAGSPPHSPPSPASRDDAEIGRDRFILSPAPRPSSRAQSLVLSPHELASLREPTSARTPSRREHSRSLSSFNGSAASSGAESPSLTPLSGHSPLPSQRHASSGSENIRVIVRCRPALPHEQSRASASGSPHLTFSSNPPSLSVDYKSKKKAFAFDAVFPPHTPQSVLYSDAAADLIDQALQGYNGTIFAYGQTGSGKSHTMMGDLGSEEEAGLIPRAIGHIFASIEREVEEGAGRGLAVSYTVGVSFLEIYNEKASDLLVTDKIDLEIREQDGMFFAPLLTRTEVHDREQLLELIRVGNDHRNVAATSQNSRSSRSHTILTLYLEKRVVKTNEPAEAVDASLFISSKLNLVDLAGSERLTSSTKQKQGRETLSINLSLSCLSNCILCLTEGSVPTYRDSKLTRLLKDSLGGNSKTTMIACISVLDHSISESVSTLRWAERAKRVKNQPVLNDGDKKDARLRELREEVAAMRAKVTGRNKDMIRMLWMVKQLSSTEGGAAVHGSPVERNARMLRQRTGSVDFELTEAILQDPFNHPMAALVAREAEDNDASNAFLHGEAMSSLAAKMHDHEEKQNDSDAPGDDQADPSTLSQHRELFPLFKAAMMAVNAQIRTEVRVVPAFEPSPLTVKRTLGGQGPSSRRVSGGDVEAQLKAMREAMEEAERERVREAEARAYTDGVLADTQRALQEAVEGKMDALMRCRCKEMEGKAEALAIRVDEEVKARTAVEDEKRQLWAAVEEGEKERAEERRQLDALKTELDRLRQRDQDRAAAHQDEDSARTADDEVRRHEQAEAAARYEQITTELMHLEGEKRRADEERAAVHAQLAAVTAQLAAVQSRGVAHEDSAREQRTQSAELKDEVESVRAAADEWQRKCEAAESALDLHRKHQADAEHQQRTLQQELTQQLAAIEALQSAHASRADSLVAAERSNAELAHELASLKSYTTAQTAARETENRALKQAAKEKAQAAQEAEVRAEEAMARLEKLRDALRAKDDDVRRLTAEVTRYREDRDREDSERSAQLTEELRRSRQALRDLQRSLVGPVASPDSATAAAARATTAWEGQAHTMRALSETLTHAQVRAMLSAGPTSPASSASTEAPFTVVEEGTVEEPLDALIASIAQQQSVAITERTSLQRALEFKQVELDDNASEYEARIASLRQSVDQLQSQRCEQDAEAAQLRQRVIAAEDVIQALRAQLTQLEQSADGQLTALSAQQQSSATAHQALQTLLDEERARAQRLLGEMAMHATSVQDMQRRHDAALQVKDEEVERLREEQRQAAESIEEWKVELERLEDARRREVDVITADLRVREGRLTEVQDAMDALAKDNVDEQDRREALETDVKLLSEELERRAQHAQTQETVQAATLQQVAEAEVQLRAVTEQHAALVAHAQTLQQRLELVQLAQQGEASGLTDALEVASGRIAELERETSSAGGKLSAAEGQAALQSDVVRGLELRIAELQAELSISTAALRADIASVEEQQARSVEDHNRVQEALRAQLLAAEEALTQRSSQVDAVRAQHAAAVEETTAVQQRLDQLQQTEQGKTTRAAEQDAVIAELSHHSQQQAEEKGRLEAGALDLQSQLTTAISGRAQLRSAVEQLSGELADARSREEALRAALSVVEAQHSSAALTTVELQQVEQAQQDELRTLHVELLEQTTLIAQQEATIAALQRNVAVPAQQPKTSGTDSTAALATPQLDEALLARLSTYETALAQRSAQLEAVTRDNAARVDELHAEIHHLSAQWQRLSEENAVLSQQLNAQPPASVDRRLRESERSWREKAQRLSALVLTNDATLAELRRSLQRSEDALTLHRSSLSQSQADVQRAHAALVVVQSSQLQLLEERLQATHRRLSSVEAEASPDAAARVAVIERGLEVGEAHPLYEATSELRLCCAELRAAWADAVQGKRVLAISTASEVEEMRNELRAWRNEDRERTTTGGQRTRRAADGWHDARQAGEPSAKINRPLGCSIM